MSDTVTVEGKVSSAIAQAEKALASAVVKRAEVIGRLGEANARLQEAAASRKQAVQALLNADPAGVSLKAVDEAVQAAQLEADALSEALALAEQKVTMAEGKVAAMVMKQNRLRLRSAVKNYIAVLEEGDELGRVILQYVATHEAAKHEVMTAMRGANVTSLHLNEALKNHRLMQAVIPPQVQTIIVQTGSVIHYSLAERGRSVWNSVLLDLSRLIEAA